MKIKVLLLLKQFQGIFHFKTLGVGKKSSSEMQNDALMHREDLKG